jgi:uncharacterized protein with NRDE domain
MKTVSDRKHRSLGNKTMCLILLAHEYIQEYKLILLSNRDEYHDRKALPAAFWKKSKNIFGGIDEREGGSWLSVDKKGRLAAVTNVRKAPFIEDNKKSRGKIVADFLKGTQNAETFLQKLQKKDADYGLFNLILFDSTGLWHYTNDGHTQKKIDAGIHGLSNASLNTPWPKVYSGCATFKHQLDDKPEDELALMQLMWSQERPSDAVLPYTGIELPFERLLSPIFIQSEDYGTRCSTLVTISNDTLKVHEYSYNTQGIINNEVQQTIVLD